MTTSNTQLATRTEQPLTMGFGSLASFEFMQRTAKMFAASSMVPTAYRATISKRGQDENGLWVDTIVENPSAIPNAMIALNMSQRMNADPLMIMQNLHVIEGRPSWSSQFIIAAINSCGRYSPLRFDIKMGDEIDATYTTYEGYGKAKKAITSNVRVKNATCIAWAVELATQTRLESPMVSMEMAVNEGWYGKNGSKWQSMPDLMLRYRSAAFFGRIYAPELLMGLPTSEETADIITMNDDGTIANISSGPVPAGKPRVVMPQAVQVQEPEQQASTVAPKVDPETGEIHGNDNEASPPTPGPAPAPQPPAAPREPTPAGQASEGERKLIINRARNSNIDMAELMEQAGMSGLPADLAGLTKDGFIALRDCLPKAA